VNYTVCARWSSARTKIHHKLRIISHEFICKFFYKMFLKHPATASRAKGMYDNEYQVNARNWIITQTITRTPLPTKKATSKVAMSDKKKTIVAMIRVFSNIFLSCVRGPIKNAVEPIAAKVPRV